MQSTPQTPREALQLATGIPVGMLFGGIGRLVFDSVTEMSYILKNKTVVTWTVLAGIVIPAVAFVLLLVAKANHDKNPKLARGLAIPVIFLMIGAIFASVFGMCYFPDYSYTLFDTFVKDFMNLATHGTAYVLDIIDDAFVLIVFIMAVQGISVIGKVLSPAATQHANVGAPVQGPRTETYHLSPIQAPAQPYAQPPPYAQPSVQPAPQPYVASSYQSYVQRPPQLYSQPAPQQPDYTPPEAMGPVNAKYCRFCGAQLPDQAHFCGNCGRQLSKPARATATEPEPPAMASTESVYIPVQATPPAVVPGPVIAPGASLPATDPVAVTAPPKASGVTYVEQQLLEHTAVPEPTVPVVTVPAAAAPGGVTTTVAAPPLAIEPDAQGSTMPSTLSPSSTGGGEPIPVGVGQPALPATTPPAGTTTPVPASTTGSVNWAQAGEKTKAFFRQFTRWDTTKAFFRWLGAKIEQGFGWAFQKAFKKVPNQKTTWSCILLMAGIVVAFIIVGAALTPGPFLAGTWRTAFVTNFNIQTTASGSLQYVGSEQRTMTWTISRTFNPTVVNVDVSFNVVSQNIIGTYTPDVSGNTYEGRISGTRLTLVDPASMFFEERVVGTFSFTSMSIMGTWNDSWTGYYYQMVYTSVNGLTLVR